VVNIKPKIKYFAIIFTIAILFIKTKGQAWAEPLSLSNFAWIGNNSQPSGEAGDPTIGMIAMSGGSFQAFLEDGSGTRLLRGKAWIGIGTQDDKTSDFSNQNDSPSIGWVVFDQGVPVADCFGAGDCYPVRWNQKKGSSNIEGYLSGWAILELGKDGSGSDYPAVWIHFKAPADPENYTCNDGSTTRNKDYFVCIDGESKLHGYAWSSGLQASSVSDNPGLGWIGFSRVTSSNYNGNLNNNSVSPGQSCATALISKNSNENGNLVCGASGSAVFKAECSGNVDPESYRWKCSSSGEYGDPQPDEITHECNYFSTGIFYPSAIVKDRTTGNEIPTNPVASIQITDKKSCQVEIKRLNSNDNTYSTQMDSYTQEEVEARVANQCLSNGTIDWNVINGTVTEENQEQGIFRAIVRKAGAGTVIKATINNPEDNTSVECGDAVIEIRDKLKWGQ